MSRGWRASTGSQRWRAPARQRGRPRTRTSLDGAAETSARDEGPRAPATGERPGRGRDWRVRLGGERGSASAPQRHPAGRTGHLKGRSSSTASTRASAPGGAARGGRGWRTGGLDARATPPRFGEAGRRGKVGTPPGRATGVSGTAQGPRSRHRPARTRRGRGPGGHAQRDTGFGPETAARSTVRSRDRRAGRPPAAHRASARRAGGGPGQHVAGGSAGIAGNPRSGLRPEPESDRGGRGCAAGGADRTWPRAVLRHGPRTGAAERPCFGRDGGRPRLRAPASAGTQDTSVPNRHRKGTTAASVAAYRLRSGGRDERG